MLDCARELHCDAGARVRAWLHDRGLKDETLADWFVGRNGRGQKRHGLYVPRGFVIPHYHRITGDVWVLKIRRPTNKTGERYARVGGHKPHLWGLDNLMGHDVVFVCESEFDGPLL